MEVARVNLQFRKVNRDGEITLVRSHQALATLRLPQPIRGGNSILSAMDLKLVTMMHLLLKGESFWGLADRMKDSGSPTKVNVYSLGFVRACYVTIILLPAILLAALLSGLALAGAFLWRRKA